MKLILLLVFFCSIIKAEIFDVGFDLDIDEPGDAFNSYGKRNDKSKGLQEFTPIRNVISESETQYYSFAVNTSSGLGEYYEFLIFLTGNICSQPSNVESGDPSLAVYYSFNSTMFNNFEIGQMALFQNGYFQALADVPIANGAENKDSILYIAVRAAENTDKSATWSYEIGVSQNDLVFQWDNRSWASLVDADDSSALFVTGNLSSNSAVNISTLNATESKYSLFVYSYNYKNYFDSLNSSWCAIRNGPALFSGSDFQSSYTTRGGGLQKQFYISGLNSSTKYIAYLTSDFSGTDFGGAVYSPFEFETLDPGVCDLIYDLDFCDQVAYSVPTSKNVTKQQLTELYDNRTRSLYSNFSKALQQIACDTTDDAIFSPMRTCDDCAISYKNWLCSVTIPRCSTRNVSGYKERAVGNSRNDFINDDVQPQSQYFEILPCVNVCYAMVKDCPSDFGFMCPTSNETISLSYYWDFGGDYPTCNYVGKILTYSNGAIRVTLGWWLVILVFLSISL